MSAPEAAPLPSATVLLLRDAEAGLEVFMVKRHHQIDFASGALVFPGGKSHAGDHDPAWAEHVLGWEAYDAEQRGLRIAAVREVFEEAGILLAKRRDGAPMSGEACPMEVRLAVDAGTTAFIDVVRDLEARLDLSALTVFARWITPPLTPKRFDTWFYAVNAPAEQLAACDGRETVDAEWIAPAEALAFLRVLRTLRLLHEGALDPLDWVETKPLTQGARAFAGLDRGEIAAAKVVLQP